MTPSAPDPRSLSRARAAPADARATHAGVPHPAVRWKTRILVPAMVIAATAGVLAYAARDALRPRTAVWVAAAIPKSALMDAESVAAPAAPDAPPDTSPDAPTAPAGAQRGDEPGAVLVQAPGWVEPSPYPISVPALTEGVVREVLVLEGEEVKAGQVVARLLDEDIRLQVRAAEAALAQRGADVERARSAIAGAEAQVRVEEAVAAELRDEVARKRELVDVGGISAGDFRRMEIRLGGLEAKVAAAERVADEARAALRQAESAVAAAAVAVEEANLRLHRSEVRAPTGGVVMARLVEPGARVSMVSQGGEAANMPGTVLRLYDPARLQVRVDVPLADAAKVGVGTPCSITSEALPDITFRGRVIRIVHEANIQRNTVQFKVSIDEPSPVLKPEMLTRVKLHAGSSRGSAGAATSGVAGADGELPLLVPTSAVSGSPDGASSVWIVEFASGSPAARRRTVQTSSAPDEGYTLIRSGLRLTDRVILDPPAMLRDGSLLRVLGERTTSPPPIP